MRNLLFTLAFDGSRFSGWQIQQNAPTVQGAFQEAFVRQFVRCPALKGCSRTDAGVHANMFCISMKTELPLPCARIQYALNCVLPSSVAVTGVKEVSEDFHARYSCLRKQYLYKIWNGGVKNPFAADYALFHRFPLDENSLHQSAQSFVGTHDFSAFQAAGSKITNPVRTIFSASVAREESWVLFTVEGDGFLYNMVRIMTGTLLDIAGGRIAPDAIPQIIASKDRTQAGFTAPPQGLYLSQVHYEVLP